MNTLNRSINTNHSANNQKIFLEFTSDSKYNGENVKAGHKIECTKSEAKRILSMRKDIKLSF